MLTAIITDLNDASRLEATLAALAPAAVDGYVRQLLVIAEGAEAAALELAEEAGADAVDGFAAACAQARQPWLLILPAGVRPQVGWEAAVRGHMRRHPWAAGHFIGASAEVGLAGWVGEGLAGLRGPLLGRPAAEQGLLVSTKLVAEIAAADREALVRGLGRGRLRRMSARALASAR